MDISKKIKMICVDKDMRQADLAALTNLTPGSLQVKLSRGIVKIDDAEKLLNALDCELVVVDRKTKKVY